MLRQIYLSESADDEGRPVARSRRTVARNFYGSFFPATASATRRLASATRRLIEQRKRTSGLTDPSQLAPFDANGGNKIQVIIETPKGSRKLLK